MTTAKFTIQSTASTPPGYDATASAVLTLQLEDLPALDAWDVQFSVTQSSSGAPTLTFSPSDGKPTTPGGTVTVTMPASGVHSYVLTCVVNTGVNASGTTVAAYTYSRLIAIKSGALRKITPAERTEYDETYGWSDAINDMVDVAPTISVRIPLISGGMTSTKTSSSTDAILTTRPIRVAAECAAPSTVLFWAYEGRTDTNYGTYKVQLYNETDNVSVVILTSSTTPAQLSSDVTASLLSAAEKTYSIRAWCADPAWAINTAYALNAVVTNDGGKIYKCVTAGTSAGAGGPTGTGTGIADNTAVWDYVAANGTVAVSQAELRIT